MGEWKRPMDDLPVAAVTRLLDEERFVRIWNRQCEQKYGTAERLPIKGGRKQPGLPSNVLERERGYVT